MRQTGRPWPNRSVSASLGASANRNPTCGRRLSGGGTSASLQGSCLYPQFQCPLAQDGRQVSRLAPRLSLSGVLRQANLGGSGDGLVRLLTLWGLQKGPPLPTTPAS